MVATWTGRRARSWHGKAEVFIDGKLVATVDLIAPADGPRRSVRRHWASVGTHHLRIAVLGTTGRPTVDVDASSSFAEVAARDRRLAAGATGRRRGSTPSPTSGTTVPMDAFVGRSV